MGTKGDYYFIPIDGIFIVDFDSCKELLGDEPFSEKGAVVQITRAPPLSFLPKRSAKLSQPQEPSFYLHINHKHIFDSLRKFKPVVKLKKKSMSFFNLISLLETQEEFYTGEETEVHLIKKKYPHLKCLNHEITHLNLQSQDLEIPKDVTEFTKIPNFTIVEVWEVDFADGKNLVKKSLTLEKMCRFVRFLERYDGLSKKLVRVKFVNTDKKTSNWERGYSEQLFMEFVQVSCQKGIMQNSTQLTFLCPHDLKNKSAWFLKDSKLGSNDILSTIGNFGTIESPAKRAARIQHLFSKAEFVARIPPSFVQIIDDIILTDKKGRKTCATDGNGFISLELAAAISLSLQLISKKDFDSPDYLNLLQCGAIPSLFHIRYMGTKGTVLVDPKLGIDGDEILAENLPVVNTNEQNFILTLKPRYHIALRPSMIKFKTCQDFIDLDVIGWSKKSIAHLNAQCLTVLEGLGISHEYILEMYDKECKDIQQISQDPKILLAKKDNSPIMREVKELIAMGCDLSDPYLCFMLQKIQKLKIRKLKATKCKLKVELGANAFGAADPKGVLLEDEIFFQSSHKDQHNIKDGSLVIITKNPCHFLSDVQIFKIKNHPSLSHLSNCIIFPVKGERSATDKISGSDLDGDKFFIFWDPQLLPKYTPQIEPHFFAEYKDKSISKNALVELCCEEHERKMSLRKIWEMADVLSTYDTTLLPGATHKHMAYADLDGLQSPMAEKCAELCSKYVDAAKNTLDDRSDIIPAPKKYPDFMQEIYKEGYKVFYHSEKILGKIYKKKIDYFGEIPSQPDDNYFTDSDFVLEGFAATLNFAKKYYKNKKNKIEFSQDHEEGIPPEDISIMKDAIDTLLSSKEKWEQIKNITSFQNNKDEFANKQIVTKNGISTTVSPKSLALGKFCETLRIEFMNKYKDVGLRIKAACAYYYCAYVIAREMRKFWIAWIFKKFLIFRKMDISQNDFIAIKSEYAEYVNFRAPKYE